MIFYIFVLACLRFCFSQVKHTPVEAKVVDVKVSPIVKAIASKHLFQTSYPGMGYQIAGSVYETNEGLSNDQIHDKKYYNPSTSCQFYNSQLNVNQISSKDLEQGLTIVTYLVSQKQKSIYLIVTNGTFSSQSNKNTKFFIEYEFTQNQIKLKQSKIPILVSSLGLVDSQNVNILMNMINDIILITDGSTIVMMHPQTYSHEKIVLNNSSSAEGGVNGTNEMIQFDIGYSNQKGSTEIAILWKTVLRIYNLRPDSKTITLKQQFVAPLGKYFTSAVIHFDYYALIQKQMVVYRQQKDKSYKIDYIDLESSQCWQLNKYESTIHMICKESQVNYVAEFYYNHLFDKVEDALKLNRYYNQIDDAKLIFRFGSQDNPKLLIAGDYDQILTSFAINRKILLQSTKYQTVDTYKTLGVEDIQTIKSYSNQSLTFGIGIGTDFLYSFNIVEQPSQLQCMLERKGNHVRWNILVELNTTSCLANGDIEQLESICRTLIPYQLYVSLFEIDSSRQFTVNLAVYVLMFILGVMIVGCTMKCKKLFRTGREQIRKKIDALKKKKEMRPN